MKIIIEMLLILLLTGNLISQEAVDKFLWLEEVDAERAIEWVKAKNEITTAVMEKNLSFQLNYNKISEILNSKERIASLTIIGDYIYNLWQDEKHGRGIWRRTSLDEYK